MMFWPRDSCSVMCWGCAFMRHQQIRYNMLNSRHIVWYFIPRTGLNISMHYGSFLYVLAIVRACWLMYATVCATWCDSVAYHAGSTCSEYWMLSTGSRNYIYKSYHLALLTICALNSARVSQNRGEHFVLHLYNYIQRILCRQWYCLQPTCTNTPQISFVV